jgi:60 kDa SS-A/Ro ribonucleoprotein
MSYVQHVAPKSTPQTQPIFGQKQVVNSAGGYVYEISKWDRLNRFLILGCPENTYYSTAKKLTVENAQCVLDCAKEDAQRTIGTIVQISDAGRAPKNDPAVFALGLLAGNGYNVAEALPKVCRIGTHLFMFVETVNALRGWGRSLRRAVAGWYTSQDPSSLAYGVVKYQQRNGWSHRDVLRLCHAKSESLNPVFQYITKGFEVAAGSVPPIVIAHESAKGANEGGIVNLIRESNLPRESIPTQHLNSPKVWEALLENMPITAMVRNLGKMSAIGLLAPLSDASQLVSERLMDVSRLKKGRVHPIALLIAQKIYAQGKGDKGSLTWTPVPQVVDALNDAFYLAFEAVEPTGKKWLVGVDVSGSMASGSIAGCPLTPREGAAALAMTLLRTEPQTFVHGFQGGRGQWSSSRYALPPGCKDDALEGFLDLGLSKSMRLDQVIQKTANLPFGGTDCAIPMLYAMKKHIPVDAFCLVTDNETWQGNVHASVALKQYRKEMGIDAKMIVIGMTATKFSIADPNDPGSLDVVGFDASCPVVMSDFVR